MATARWFEDLICQVNYNYPKELYKAVKNVTDPSSFPDLRLKVQTPSSRDWASNPLLYLEGRVPLICHNGHSSQVPVWMWIPESFPFSPPELYVRSTPQTPITTNQHWNHDGKVNLQYLKEWEHWKISSDHPKPDLVDLLHIFLTVLSDESNSVCPQCVQAQSERQGTSLGHHDDEECPELQLALRISKEEYEKITCLPSLPMHDSNIGNVNVAVVDSNTDHNEITEAQGSLEESESTTQSIVHTETGETPDLYQGTEQSIYDDVTSTILRINLNQGTEEHIYENLKLEPSEDTENTEYARLGDCTSEVWPGEEHATTVRSDDTLDTPTGELQPVQEHTIVRSDDTLGTSTEGSLPVQEQATVRGNAKKRSSTIRRSLPAYRVNSHTPGIVYILNIDTFETNTHHPYRRGSQKDVEKMTKTFDGYGFEVEVVQNLRKMALIQTFVDWAKNPKLEEVSACIVVLMSHGEEDALIAADGEPVSLKELTSYFNGKCCPALKGKPKMFVVQACRGNQTDTGVGMEEQSAAADMAMNVNDATPMQKIPADADMVFAFSTMPGHKAWRDVDGGSWYIDAFCRVFDEYAESVDVMRMLIMINKTVATEYKKASGEIQMPMPRVSLLKDWYLTGPEL